MSVAKRVGVALLAGMLCSVANAKIWDERAKQLLLKSLQHAYDVNVQAIVVQYCPDTESYQQLKLEQTRTGRSRYTILTPLRDQGVESVDDGTRAVTYLPDNKLVLVQASTRNQGEDCKERIARAEKNYRLSWEESPDIAGRPVVCITATPKAGPLEERRFYIDTETAYLLRCETVTKGGTPQVKYDTKCVVYPEEMAEPKVAISAFGAKTVKYESQVKLSKAISNSQLGFDPIIPTQLPYGFAVMTSQVTSSKSWKAAVVRITDGLVMGAVYQWKPEPESREPALTPDRSSIRSHGLSLLMVADIPRNARERILQSFAESGAHASLHLPDVDWEPNYSTVVLHNLGGLRSTARFGPVSTD